MLLAREEARVKGYLPENSPLFQTTVSRKTEMNSTVAKEGMSTEGLLRSCALDDRHMMTVNLGSLNYGLCLFATIPRTFKVQGLIDFFHTAPRQKPYSTQVRYMSL